MPGDSHSTHVDFGRQVHCFPAPVSKQATIFTKMARKFSLTPAEFLRRGLIAVALLVFILAPRLFVSLNLFMINVQGRNNSLFIVWFGTICRSFVWLGIPLSLFNLVGILTLPSQKRQIFPLNSPLLAPFICFRVVTRGIFPELVQRNVKQNHETCLKAGLTKFMFQVVTDKPVYLRDSRATQELVVPDNYRTPKGTMFKARALHFCNEREINQLNPDDWIVHLDEETLLTEESIVGILNFVSDGSADFGQGAITYASGNVVNWITTLIDSVRVGIDHCYLRFALNVLHRPLLNWKGSYVVARAGAEHDVSFDHGFNASVAEDCFFGAMACAKGYKFGFIEGIMMEQSTYTFTDFLKQRKRWNQGMYLTVRSSEIPVRHKIGLFFVVASALTLPLVTVGIILTIAFSIPQSFILKLAMEIMQGIYCFLYVYGAYYSLSKRQCRHSVRLMIAALSLLVTPLSLVLESIAAFWASLTLNKIEFHIVKKDYNRKFLSIKESGRIV